LRQERRDVEAALRDALKAYLVPIPGSPRAADVDWLMEQPKDRRDPLKAVAHAALEEVAELMRVTRENIVGLEALLAADELLPIPSMTLVRSVHEAVVMACALCDPIATPSLRMARGAAGSLHAVQESHKVLTTVPGDHSDKLTETANALTGMQDWCQEAGFKLTFSPKAPGIYLENVRYEGMVANLIPNTTLYVETYTPGTKHNWAIGSGASHTRRWLTAGMEGPAGEVVAGVVAPIFDMIDALLHNVLGYVGLCADGYHQKTHVRRVAILGRARPREVVGGWADYATKMRN